MKYPANLRCCLMVQDTYLIEALISEIQPACNTTGSTFNLSFSICFALAPSTFFVLDSFVYGLLTTVLYVLLSTVHAVCETYLLVLPSHFAAYHTLLLLSLNPPL